ncbi:alpha/beta fold hydrolase [Lichenicoccus sp.]|uniref:alpha/beta fold hydrolase n=1 Tax=Lichenicoccus sp. TaxID=2781899 RepID=UPI003D0E8591
MSISQSIRTRELTVDSVTFTACEAGEGSLVLMVHGFPDEPATFDAQLLALAEAGFHAVAPTLRGYEDLSRHGFQSKSGGLKQDFVY